LSPPDGIWLTAAPPGGVLLFQAAQTLRRSKPKGEAIQAGDDLDTLRRQLPEEFWGDFDAITKIPKQQIDIPVRRNGLNY